MEMNRNYTRVYVAGPLRGNWLKKKINIYRAKKTAEWLWKRGLAVFCPHMNSGFVDSFETDDFVLPANVDFMHSCDVLLVTGKWWKSQGTTWEIKRAYEHAMPIYFDKVVLYKDLLGDDVK